MAKKLSQVLVVIIPAVQAALAAQGVEVSLVLAALLWLIVLAAALKLIREVTKDRRKRIALSGVALICVGAMFWLIRPQQAAVPVAVTQMFIEPRPYEAGRPLRLKLELNSAESALTLRGFNTTYTGIADNSAFIGEKRLQNENDIWQLYEKDARLKSPIKLAAIKGLMTVHLEGPVLSERDAAALNGAEGVVYVVGQIDYGAGVLDYCGYWRPYVSDKEATLCVEHNGPGSESLFTP